MRILIYMNLSPIWAAFLNENSIEAVHWTAVDLDFGSILAAANANAPSVFQIRTQNLLPDVIGDRVVECLKQYEHYFEEGSLVTLFDQKSKVRILLLQ